LRNGINVSTLLTELNFKFEKEIKKKSRQALLSFL
jgi:hypothetical protein